MSYKASVSNIYELLNEDGEEGRRQTPQVNVGGDDKPVAAKKAPAAAPAKAQTKPKSESPKVDRPAQPKGRQEDRRPRDVAPKAEGEETVAGKQPRQRREGSERGAGRGGFVPRGNKRPFDRRSGTGRGKENKKGGAGKGNWGTVADDEAGQSESQKQEKTETQEAQPQGEETQQPAAAAAETQPAAEQKEPEEEEDKTKTLEEYLKAKKTLKIELPKPRQSGEGATGSEWSGFVELKKKDEEGLVVKKEEKKKEGKKDVVPVNEVFKIQEEAPFQKKGRRDNASDRGGRGGASKRGGAGGAGGKRGGSGKPAPNVNDESSFPALATKA